MRPAILSAPRSPAAAGVDVWRGLAAAVVVAAVFKLAISDGGRHADSLALVQTGVLAGLVVLAAAGRVRPGLLAAGITAVIAAVALTTVWSVRSEASVRELLLWITYLGIAVIAAWSLAAPRAAGWFADGLIVVTGWLCFIALFMFWGNDGDTAMRWSSTFYWPNPFAAFLLLVFPLAAARMLRAASPRDAAAYGGAATLLGVALVFTASRGAWIAAAVGLPVMLAVLRPPSWRLAVGRAIVAAAVIAAAVLLLGRVGSGDTAAPIVSRAASLADPADPSVQGRLNFWGSALRIFADHPVVGTGAGTFGAVHPAYQREARFYARDAHNLYVQTLAEMGLLGGAALVMLLFALVGIWVAALRAASSADHYSVVAGAGIGLLVFLVHSAVDMDWFFPANPAMAFALAGMLSAAVQESPGPLRGMAVSRRGGWRGGAWVARVVLVIMLLAAIAAVQMGQAGHDSYVQAQVAARAGRWDDAAALYAQAARWNPLSALYPSAEALAVMQTHPADRRRAEAALRRAMALDRANAAHPIQLARIISGGPTPTAGEVAEAEALLRRALAFDPFNRPAAYRDLARLYLRQGRREEAGRVYDDAAARYVGQGLGRGSLLHLFLWPEILPLVLDAAEFAVEAGDVPRAERMLEQVLAEDPSAIPAALRLSALYVSSGRPAAARAVLEEAARHVPGDERIRRALVELP